MKPFKSVYKMGQSGQSLIASVVATGVSLMALTSSMSLVDNSVKASRLVASTADLSTSMSLVDLILNDEQYCKVALKMGANAPSFNAGVDTVALTSIDFNGRSVLALDDSIGNFSIDTISLSREGTSPRYIGTITVKLNKTGNGPGASSSQKEFYLNLETTPLGGAEVVTSCSTQSQPTDPEVPTSPIRYQTSCLKGEAGYGFPLCCQINSRTGEATCRQSTDWYLSSWVVAPSVFSASTTGDYSIACAEGTPGGATHYCCRSNNLTGETDCMTSNAWSPTAWIPGVSFTF